MLVCYTLERRSHWFVLGFAGACALGSAYGSSLVAGGSPSLAARIAKAARVAEAIPAD